MRCVLPICVALLFAGCSATRELTAFEAASSEKALIRWQRKRVSLVCDAVCARSQNGAVLVRLYKQSPAPLAEFRLEPGNYFAAKGRLAGRGWAGPPPRAPTAFSSWIAFLTAYQESAGLETGALATIGLSVIGLAIGVAGMAGRIIDNAGVSTGFG